MKIKNNNNYNTSKMKKQVIAISLGLMTIGSFAQKNELKAAEKAFKKQNYTAAIAAVNSVDGMLASMDAKYKSKYYFIKGKILAAQNKNEDAANAFNALISYEKEIKKKRYTKDVKPLLSDLVLKVSNLAIKQYNSKDYANAKDNFYLTYTLSPVDTTFLYNAAVSASIAKDFDTSLKFYKELKEIGYSGVVTQYFAVNKETSAVEDLGSKSKRDLMVKTGKYTNPTQKTSDSKQAEIVKNIGYILVNQGKTEEAIVALQEARRSNPKDINLILNEAQLYIKLEKMDKFGELMKEAVQLDPTNPTLFFNLGVVNANEGKTEEAVKYYKKAIELKPDYADAYMNLAVAMLGEEKALIEEMNNNLSNFKKYDELLAKQKELYKKALPYLIKADSLKRSEGTVRTLLNMYDTLEMTKEAAALRVVYKEMRSK